MAFQPATVVFPDVELTLTTLMRPLLPTGTWVDRKTPAARTQRMVVFIRDGGASANFRDVARVRVLVWESTDQKATDLARQVVGLMQKVVTGDPITNVAHLSGPYEIADNSGQPCRYLLFDVTTRGEQLP